MSLSEASEGILETHVTWEEFESNLTNALNTTAKLGSNKKAIDVGEGNGFASKCALITCDWEGEGAEQLPKRVVLKMGTCMALVELTQSGQLPPDQNIFKHATPELWTLIGRGIKAMHNIECDAYDLFDKFGERNATLKKYYAKPFSAENKLAGQICMEFVEGSRTMNVYENATIDQIKQIARALGKLQADSTKLEGVRASLTTKDVFGEFSKSTPKQKYVKMFSALKEVEASLTEPIEKIEGLLADYYGASLPSTIHRQLGLKPVIVSGDMRTENIIVDGETGDLRGIIDWQCAHFGVGVEDLLRISFFGQSTEDRRASADALLEEMHNAFLANLGGAPAPFTLEQIKEVYDLLFPHCAIFFASALGVLMPAAKTKAPHEEEGRKRYDVVVDKARGVFEDIAVYHEKNKKSARNLSWKYTAP